MPNTHLFIYTMFHVGGVHWLVCVDGLVVAWCANLSTSIVAYFLQSINIGRAPTGGVSSSNGDS